MGKKTELIITKGQEFKIVVKDSIRDDDVFIEQYEQAAGMLNTIVAESIVAAEKSDKTFNALYSLNEYENNIIAFCGERGEGKSSAMLTFINSLYTNLPKALQGEDKFYEKYQELYKVHFSEPIIIDPSQFDDVHNILDIVLAKIYRNFSRRYEEDNRCVDEFDINRLQNQFQKVYREVSMINNQSKMLDDEFDYEGNIGKLSKLGESTDLKEDLQELIKQYLEFVKKCSNRENGKERLIIAIDDLDLCNSNAYKMAEQIRKYLIIPQIVIIMAVKIEQLEMCVEENTIADFKGIVGIVKQYRNEEQKRINAEIQGMSERYVTKLIPKARRIYLPKVQSFEGMQIVYKEKDDNIIWKSKKDESLVNAVLHLITERTGMIYLPERSGMSYLLPNNLRDMVNWIVFIAEMDQKDNVENSNTYLKNVREFSKYFYNEWLTKQVPKTLGDELRTMEQMDSYHVNMNAKWILSTIYAECDRKEKYVEHNIKSDEQNNFWKVMQWILRFDKVVFDFEAKREAYALKVMYTMKINQWIITKRLSDVSYLINGYIWGGEFEGVLPKTELGISRSRFQISSRRVMQVIGKKFNVDFIKDLDSNSDTKQMTFSNLSNEEDIRNEEIYALILVAMFSDINTRNLNVDELMVLGTDKLIAGNRRVNAKINISLENYIVSLCNLEMLIDKINIEALNTQKDDIKKIIKNMIDTNKEEIECAQCIVSNMDLASELLVYCENNRDYKLKTENAVDLKCTLCQGH
ncbi:P-loop NTPase fold protein [Mediterraneibacter faecis]|uniref:P-loop NTPase fold protein n=1 Tax=Mediterraneibacter faecis TaxID=592978 RepID=UPI001D06448F|nr:P-loop NTPase fold protein [Mediterraneibacter faecis]MCB7329115.1 hypothetical protein [Mediterraneibacter faecis]